MSVLMPLEINIIGFHIIQYLILKVSIVVWNPQLSVGMAIILEAASSLE